MEETHTNGAVVPHERADCPEFPCPDEVWRGVFAQVAKIVGKWSWEVWLGTAVALGARAHRNIHVRYHGNLYGNLYGLLIAPTSFGKSVCTDVCEALLPMDYRWDTGVQSGPGLVSILADVTRNKQGKVQHVESFPSALIVSEWTTLAKNLKIQNSTLEQDLNLLFDGKSKWTVSRSEASKQGGGRVTIFDPSLSICGTTTESLFHEEVNARMIKSGFLNRYLVLPGSHVKWKLFADGAGVDYETLRSLPLPLAHTFGLGADIWQLYAQDALLHWHRWGLPLFEEHLMLTQNGNSAPDVYKRLHTYTHKIAMLYAWSEESPLITLDHLMAAIAVVESSRRYLAHLYAHQTPDLPAYVQARAALDEEILDAVTAAPGLRKDVVCQRLKRNGGYSAVSMAIENLIRSGALAVKLEGERRTLKTLFLA